MLAGRRRLIAATALVAAALVAAPVAAEPDPDGLALVERLAAGSPAEVAAAVVAIEAMPVAQPHAPDAWFAAARACEDVLHDPARALALYDRLLAEAPTARVAAAAARRAEPLRAQLGAHHEHAGRAAELQTLLVEADALPAAEVEARARALAAADWPGAPEAALWLAEWLRRHDRLAAAQAAYAAVEARWPDRPEAVLALRGAAGNALAAGDWARAEALTRRLPAVEPADRVLRDELLEAAERGRRRERWFIACCAALVAIVLGLLGSLFEAARRGDPATRCWPRPPVELAYLAPLLALLCGLALTMHTAVAPAVLALSVGALVLSGLSGATLDALRARGRSVRSRAVVHVVACVVATAALVYAILSRGALLDLVLETVRFGPGG